MAKHEIVMPQMGESITNGTITKWHKQAGDMIELDEILLEISTDKVESEIPSPMEGRIEEILFPEGETIDIGIKIAVIEDDPSNVAFGGGASTEASSAPKAAAPTEASAPAATEPEAPAKAAAPEKGEGRRFYTPLVRSLANKHGVELSELEHIKGSGAAGRVNKADFMNFLDNRGSAPKAASASSSAATPAAAKPTIPAFAAGDRVEIIPMDNMRKVIARNMVASKQISPHVNSIDTVDMTKLVKFREGFKNEFKKQLL